MMHFGISKASMQKVLTQVGCTRQVRRAAHALADWLACRAVWKHPRPKNSLRVGSHRNRARASYLILPQVSVCRFAHVLRSWAQSLSIRVSSPQKTQAMGDVVLAWALSGVPGYVILVPGNPGDIARYVCGQEAGPGWLSWLARLAGWPGPREMPLSWEEQWGSPPPGAAHYTHTHTPHL